MKQLTEAKIESNTAKIFKGRTTSVHRDQAIGTFFEIDSLLAPYFDLRGSLKKTEIQFTGTIPFSVKQEAEFQGVNSNNKKRDV